MKLSKKYSGGNKGKKKKSYKLGPGGINTVTFTTSEGSKNYQVPHSSDMVKPKVWELPNRKRFFNWVDSTFGKYNFSKDYKPSPAVEKERERQKSLDKINLNNMQMLARDFMQGESPYRGLLLYLGLGVGKTCAAIAVTQAIMNKKEVIILSKASLEDNFIVDIQKCGADYMTKNNYWVFCKCKNDPELKLSKDLGIPADIILDNGGAFFIDFTKDKSNYQNLSEANKEKLNNQIMKTIKKRYKFLHIDDTRLMSKLAEDEFNNKVIVVDEVHNLINSMTSGAGGKEDGTPTGRYFYNVFMNAKNSKFVFLSGTPLINTVYESTKLFNILRGFIPTVSMKIKTIYDTDIEYQKIKNKLQKDPHVDQIIINKVNKTIKVSKNPDNFINSPDGKGIIYKPVDNIENQVFKENVENIVNSFGYKVSSSLNNETCLPTNINDFQLMFHNPELNKLKKTELFKKRIAGLTSYYKYQDQSLFPEVTKTEIVKIPFSDYQLSIYEKYRNQEIQKDKNARRKGKEETFKPSYRLKSRLACTFVFPEEIGSPYDDRNLETLETLGDKMLSVGEEINLEDIKTTKDIDKTIKSSYLALIDKRKDEFLDMNNGSLLKYSPKYYHMIKNIMQSRGSCFVYSYFRALIGINTFSFALEQTGNFAPFRIKKVDGYWELDEKEDEKGKFKFCAYTGAEDRELREIYRKIYNSQWDDLQPSCVKLVKQLKIQDRELNGSGNEQKNLYGKIIKVLMTTKTGAEGLNLKCVRQVHVMEPYWQPVLIEQVIGRAVRTESHIWLPPKERNVEVYIYMATFTPRLVNMLTTPAVKRDIVKFNDEALGKKGMVTASDEYLYIVSERKKKIINEMLDLVIESSVDCQLNYKHNIRNKPNIVCLDYDTENRDDYLYTSELGDTIDIIDIKQEKLVTVRYKEVVIKGKTYYYTPVPDVNGKMYIYDEKIKTSAKVPKPVGRVINVGGKLKFGLKKEKSSKSKK
jgi:superfamily II DNA or RNA helicase